MQKIKFWYAYYYQNSGNYGGCISHEVGPFTTKRAANQARKILIQKEINHWYDSSENKKVEFRFKDQEVPFSLEEFTNRWNEEFKKNNSITLNRWCIGDKMYDGSYDITFSVNQGEVDILESCQEYKDITDKCDYMKNDFDHKSFCLYNSQYLK